MLAGPGKGHIAPQRLARNSLPGYWVSWLGSWIWDRTGSLLGLYLLKLEGFGVKEKTVIYFTSPVLYFVLHHAQTKVGFLVWLELF